MDVTLTLWLTLASVSDSDVAKRQLPFATWHCRTRIATTQPGLHSEAGDREKQHTHIRLLLRWRVSCPGSGLAPTVKSPSPSSLPNPSLYSEQETVELLSDANGGVGGFGPGCPTLLLSVAF